MIVEVNKCDCRSIIKWRKCDSKNLNTKVFTV